VKTTTAAFIVAVIPAVATAGLSDTLRDPRFANLGLAPLARALADTVASTYPVASASSSVVYVYDPALDVVDRRAGTLGPILGERAATLGPGRFDVAVTYSYVSLDTIDGDSLDSLVNAPLVDGQLLFFPVPGGVRLRDGRVTTILPVRTTVDLDVTAHITTPSVTYGVTSDLDLNVSLPVLSTSLGVSTRTEVPDPRHPAYALPPGDPNAGIVSQHAADSAAGAGDLLLRAKYVLNRGAPVDMAVGLGLSFPTGSQSDFHGTGSTQVLPLLIASRRFGERVELLANLGADLDTDDVDRSSIRWVLGGTVSLVEPVTAAVTFLGRHELEAQTDPIRVPFFFQVERNDLYDAAVGLRWRFASRGVLSANVQLPLNREGVRADAIPTVELEYAF
jgi:hypothetical protein